MHSDSDRLRVPLAPDVPPADVMAEMVERSRRRSRSFGLEEYFAPELGCRGHHEVGEAQHESRLLFRHAAPVMEILYSQIANTESMVVLTNSKGLILSSLGDNGFLEKASRVALAPGAEWSERSKGTNAIGTALAEESPVTVLGGQHFLSSNRFLACSCAPIFDPLGEVIGALDVTGDSHAFHPHTLALVRMSARMIENHMFADRFEREVRLHFHARADFLGTLAEGIVVFTEDGRFVTANQPAQAHIGMSPDGLRSQTFGSLFGLPLSTATGASAGSPAPLELRLNSGVRVWGRVMRPRSAGLQPSVRSSSLRQQAPRSGTRSLDAQGSRASLSALKYLDTGDLQVAQAIDKLMRVQGRDIPVMILGETGTGKELLARAIHTDSDRSSRPFVSVNCASIPESLIESELFGYEEGAFTGAKKKGSQGLILQAHGGTLFLDEIGDMPLQLQARLLRVLQERKVTPLGAAKEIEVDIAVVCATHRNLKDLIAKGEFREDLYYRLNGLVVRLPALRERTDFLVVMRRILASLCENSHQVTVSSDVLRDFQSYHWPGNFRQLHNLLRTAVVMVGCEGEIQQHHLPDDFRDELQSYADLDAGDTRSEPSIELPRGASSADHGSRPPVSSQSLDALALQAMADALRQHRGNVSAAAKALGVSRNTIYRKKDALPPDVWG